MSQQLRAVNAEIGERRTQERHAMILRVGVLEQADRTSFCLVKCISKEGIQIRLYTSGFNAGPAAIHVADEDAIFGEIVWIKGKIAGMSFEGSIDPNTLLRFQQKLTAIRRRSLPRIKVGARAALLTGGRNLPAFLCDISSSGAKVRTFRALRDERAAVLNLPDLPSLKAYVRWTDGFDSGLTFQTPIPMQVLADWISGRMKVSV